MHRLERQIEVRAPVSAAYRQWTCFEEFPFFMEGIKEVRRVDENQLLWHAEILGQDIRWEAVVTEQIPLRRIAWESVTGHPNRGTIDFTGIDPLSSRMNLVIDYQPLGVAEELGDAFGLLSQRVDAEMERFKQHMAR
jgi:uncharacterized membrane protein